MGIGNVIRWTPIIWRDEDWDWRFMAVIMEYKLTRMANWFNAREYNRRKVRQMRVCATLLRRLHADDYDDEKRRRRDSEAFGRIVGKYLLRWWD